MGKKMIEQLGNRLHFYQAGKLNRPSWFSF